MFPGLISGRDRNLVCLECGQISVLGRLVFKKRRGAESFLGCFNQEWRSSVN